MTSAVADQLLQWLKDHPASYLEEQLGDTSRTLAHKTRDGVTLQEIPLTVDLISVLMEMNWEGRIERRSTPGRLGLHIYDLPADPQTR